MSLLPAEADMGVGSVPSHPASDASPPRNPTNAAPGATARRGSPFPVKAAELERFRVNDPGTLAELERLYVEKCYSPGDAEFLKTDAGRRDIQANVSGRYNQSLFHVLPWIQRVFDLRGADVLEIGCGTGSSTAALARLAGRVYTCDLKDWNLAVAAGRLALLGIDNVRIVLEAAPAVFARARAEFAERVDCVVLAAVLEHQTVPERIQTLREAWGALRDGGVLVVYETPNRLTYMDDHSSGLPFFHMLGDEIAMRYAHRSPRESLRLPMRAVLRKGWPAARLFLTRHGIGASYHEFELGLPRDGVAILADGHEPEMLALWPVTYEERLLRSFMLFRDMGIHPAFSRHAICVILQKRAGITGWVSETPARNASAYAATRTDLEGVRALLAAGDAPAARRRIERLLAESPGAPGDPHAPAAAPKSLMSIVRGVRRRLKGKQRF